MKDIKCGRRREREREGETRKTDGNCMSSTKSKGNNSVIDTFVKELAVIDGDMDEGEDEEAGVREDNINYSYSTRYVIHFISLCPSSHCASKRSISHLSLHARKLMVSWDLSGPLVG